MDIAKKIGIIILIILSICCIGVDVYYLWILNYGPEKLASNTVYVGLQESIDGNSSCAFKVKYNRNKDKNGHEVFAIVFNYLRDEKSSGIYSQGVQVESKLNDYLKWYDYEDYAKVYNNVNDYDVAQINDMYNENNFINLYTLHTQPKFLWRGYYQAIYISPFLSSGKMNFYSLNEGTGIGATNPINENTYFTLQTDVDTKEMVYMQFRGDNYASYENNEITADVKELGRSSMDNGLMARYRYYYNNLNINWFTYMIYNAVKAMPDGTNGYYTLEFGDYFKFYDVNEDGSVGTEIKSGTSTKVQNFIKSYFTFDIEVTAEGAKSANDSLFKVLQGSADYKIEGYTGGEGKYFNGQNIIDVTYKDFDFVKIDGINVALKLKEDFIKSYIPYKETILLNVIIDTKEITKLGFNYVGFTADSGLNEFKIYKTEVN